MKNLVKVGIDFLGEDEVTIIGTEWIWAKDMGNHLYQLENHPWMHENYRYGDIVYARYDNNHSGIIVTKLVAESPFSTILIEFNTVASTVQRREISHGLQDLNLLFEGVKNHFIAINVLPEEIVKTKKFLDKCQTAGLIKILFDANDAGEDDTNDTTGIC